MDGLDGLDCDARLILDRDLQERRRGIGMGKGLMLSSESGMNRIFAQPDSDQARVLPVVTKSVLTVREWVKDEFNPS